MGSKVFLFVFLHLFKFEILRLPSLLIFYSVSFILVLLVLLTPKPRKLSGGTYTYWDSVASPEDMEDMWNHPVVSKEWTLTGEKQGQVRFSQDDKKRPYLSRMELKV